MMTSLFPIILVTLPFSLCLESTSYVFPFRMVSFYLLIVTAGWIFTSAYVIIQSISRKVIEIPRTSFKRASSVATNV